MHYCVCVCITFSVPWFFTLLQMQDKTGTLSEYPQHVKLRLFGGTMHAAPWNKQNGLTLCLSTSILDILPGKAQK